MQRKKVRVLRKKKVKTASFNSKEIANASNNSIPKSIEVNMPVKTLKKITWQHEC
jgi:hypothetical protein